MAELIYIDTNVWIDFFLDRKDKLRPLGDFAFELIQKSLSCKYFIVVSDWLIRELKFTDHLDSFKQLEKELVKHEKVVYVKSSFEDFSIAKEKKNWHDALHEILALKSGADYLVTRNIKDFEGNIIPVVFPENL